VQQGALSLCGFLAWGAVCISTPYADRAAARARGVWAAVAAWSGLLLALQLTAQLLDEARLLPDPEDQGALAVWLRAAGLGRLQEGSAAELLLVRGGGHAAAASRLAWFGLPFFQEGWPLFAFFLVQSSVLQGCKQST
jgi:hypothetical protein